MTRAARFGTNHDRRLWSVLLLFLLAVLLPTVCLLWLINDSVAKQREINRQQLAQAYRGQLKLISERLDQEWSRQAVDMARAAESGTPAAWANAVKTGLADSLVLYDSAGRLLYPSPASPSGASQVDSPQWTEARRLEERLTREDWAAAASAYGAIAEAASDVHLAARARQAQVRCLRNSGRQEEALAVILQSFTGTASRQAKDPQGRMISADSLLLAIHIAPQADVRRLRAAEHLYRILADYDSVGMPSAQRLFLMKEMRAAKLPQNLTSFPTLDAEELAARALEAGLARGYDGMLRPSGMSGLWILGAPGANTALLLRTDTVKQRIANFLESQTLPPGVQVVMREHGAALPGVVETVPAGAYLPQWRLGLLVNTSSAEEELASRQMRLYLWTGLLVLIAICAVALLAGRAIHRQMRIANLKSDLVATVSHELKTPLASTRLLLDTLLQQDDFDLEQTREYLLLMERENSRLTQTVENFLAFSRLERNRYHFRFAEASVPEIIDRALEAFADRAAEPNVHLTVDVAPDLPPLHADAGALSTALINLLDNAYKYTGEEKRIALRVFRTGVRVCFQVEDNGIGVPKPEHTKVFRDFYQVDSRLTRAQGGVGLGLSIVRFIVQAHRGTVSVDSRVGEGSTFQLALPGIKA